MLKQMVGSAMKKQTSFAVSIPTTNQQILLMDQRTFLMPFVSVSESLRNFDHYLISCTDHSDLLANHCHDWLFHLKNYLGFNDY